MLCGSKKTTSDKGGFFSLMSKNYFFAFDLEEVVFLLAVEALEAVFLEEQEELQQDLAAFAP